MANVSDYYETLGVDRDASQSAIKSAYRRLARQHHPDVNPDDHTSELRFKEINEAYQVLSDPEKREMYDRYGHEGLDSTFGTNPGYADFGGLGDIFDIFFGAGEARSGRGRSRSERGQDLRYDVTMTLEQAYHGMDSTFTLTRQEKCDVCSGLGADPASQPQNCSTCNGTGQVRQQQNTIFGTQIRIIACPKCHGEGVTESIPCAKCNGQGRFTQTSEKTVHIPPGMDTGMRMRLAGEGGAGLKGGPSGDLYIFSHVQQHDIFERKGNDLWCNVPVSFPLAALGGVIDVKTIDGSEKLNVAAGSQSGEIYTLRHKGMPDPNHGGFGDLNVVLKIVTPTNLTEDQKALLKQFAELRGEEINEAHEKGFFERVKDAFSSL
ncbi:MAG: molecular chaperone DnaJ [Armatimonadetes bacterium]|jgi:molecular chaperone DnaJ|nr:molecular chaperone DnaJ [Armatimonadota bacterium]